MANRIQELTEENGKAVISNSERPKYGMGLLTVEAELATLTI